SSPLYPPYSTLYSFFPTRNHTHPDLHSFPTRRSSDLPGCGKAEEMHSSLNPNSTSILPTTILKQSFVDGAQYLLLFLSQGDHTRSEEHTSELQSRGHLVCRLLLEKKKRR